jgi:hypothetical protein
MKRAGVSKGTSSKKEHPFCIPVKLKEDEIVRAAEVATQIFPPNAPHLSYAEEVPTAKRISVLTQKFWGAKAMDLTVGFFNRPSQAFIDKCLQFANAWSEFSKIKFRYTSNVSDGMIRVAFERSGYWSYLGPDCLGIPKNQQTLNLEGFTVNTPISEWNRVVKHEFGHALGCPHEQQRQQILDLLDEQKTIAYFMRTQGWSEDEVRQQILVPLEERSLMQGSSPNADVTSIMCYQFPGSITKNGQPIPGGLDFSSVDREFFAKIYPKDDVVVPPQPAGKGAITTLIGLDKDGKEVSRFKVV